MKRESWLGLALAAGVGLTLAVLLMWPRWHSRPAGPAPSAAATPAATATATSAASTALPSAAPGAADAGAAAAGPCPDGMVHVSGLYCPYVAHRCDSWLGAPPRKGDPEERARRCETYRNEIFCDGRPSQLSYCIDRYEYPNLAGAKPAIMVDYAEARRACAREGKRLCEADEWRLACEGPRTLPYPTGLGRDASACNIDRRPRQPDLRALSVPRDRSSEIERLDQRLPSGSSNRCASPFGVMDMVGNVTEWVHDREGKKHRAPHSSALAGGHWEREPATCRSLDGQQGPSYRSYRAGFRCCADGLDGQPARRLLAKEARLPRRRAILPTAKP